MNEKEEVVKARPYSAIEVGRSYLEMVDEGLVDEAICRGCFYWDDLQKPSFDLGHCYGTPNTCKKIGNGWCSQGYWVREEQDPSCPEGPCEECKHQNPPWDGDPRTGKRFVCKRRRYADQECMAFCKWEKKDG